MDGNRFDELTKGLAFGASRRKVIKGLTGAVVAGVAAMFGRSETDARRVTQAYCGNHACADDPGVCNDGCVCCVWGNGNSRCMPPNDCLRAGGEPGGEVPPSQGTCPAGANRCINPLDLCNENNECGCVPTSSGGTFCAQGGNSQCSACTVDSDCDEVTGPGSACVISTGDCEGCGETQDRICWGPCPPVGA